MISGRVNASLEGIVRLSVLDASGIGHDIDAVVDTGFSGSLTLPSALVAARGLSWRNRASVILANGGIELCEVYDGTVLWDGRARPILIEEAETEPLLGMGLLLGYELRLQAVRHGDVVIQAIP
jgi:predicted aspartyl protease